MGIQRFCAAGIEPLPSSLHRIGGGTDQPVPQDAIFLIVANPIRCIRFITLLGGAAAQRPAAIHCWPPASGQ
jgi:hypothetical protein